MALLKCPDCGKMVSSRAKECPECGCPVEYMDSLEKENNLLQNETKTANEKELERTEKKEYIIANEKVCYSNFGELDYKVASVFGTYLEMAGNARNELCQVYRECKSINSVLQKVPDRASSILNQIIDNAVGLLFLHGVNLTAEEFMSKYYYSHNIDYANYCTSIVEKYSEILNMQAEMKAYREYEKASRSRWQGGGFGVKGAIKGAVTASVMNAGTDFLRSFGDRAREREDDAKVKKQLENLYGDAQTRKIMCDSIYTCIINVYLSMKDEMVEQGKIDANIFILNEKEANILFENTKKYVTNRTDFIRKVVECIKLYPANKEFYREIEDEIFDEVWEHLSEEKYSGFYEFLSIWGLESYYPKEEIEGNDNSKNVVETKKVYPTKLDEWFGERGYEDEDFEDFSIDNAANILIDKLNYEISIREERSLSVLEIFKHAEDGVETKLRRYFAHLESFDEKLYCTVPLNKGMAEYLDMFSCSLRGYDKSYLPSYEIYTEEDENLRKRLNSLLTGDEQIVIFRDLSLFNNLKKGFVITTEHFIDLASKMKYKLSDIMDICFVDEKTVRIIDKNHAVNIVIAGEANEFSYSISDRACEQTIKLFKFIACAFGGNRTLDINLYDYEEIIRKHDIAEVNRIERYKKKNDMAYVPDIFVSKIVTAITGTPAENIIVVVDADEVPDNEWKQISRTLKRINPGNKLLFRGSGAYTDVVLTDKYLCGNKNTYLLSDIKQVYFEMNSSNLQFEVGTIFLDLKNNNEKVTLVRNFPSNVGKQLVNCINIGMGIDSAMAELNKNFEEEKFDNEWEKSEIRNVPLNGDLESYEKIRRYVHVYKTAHKLESYPQNSIYSMKANDFFEWVASKDNYHTYPNVIEWIPETYTREEYFKTLAEDRSVLKYSYLWNIWLYGDSLDNKFAPTPNLINALGDEILLMYKDFSSEHTGKKGFAITDKNIIILESSMRISIEDVQKLHCYGNHSIGITDIKNNLSVIKVNSVWNDESMRWDNSSYIWHILNIIRVYCVRYGQNQYVWREGMSTPKPVKSNSKTEIESIDSSIMKIPKKETVFCAYCGKKISRASKFCNYCGEKNNYT